MKECNNCTNEYPATPKYFNRDKSTKDGLTSFCKKCRKANRGKGRKTPEQRFWPKVNKAAQNGCWEWTSTIDYIGYGRFYVDNNQRGAMAHRYSYELHFGPIENGLHCLHKCDNPSCVNPNHLFLGTVKENMRDRDTKGRAATKLTPRDVRKMRKMHDVGKQTQKEIAKKFGVNSSLVSRIVRREYWSWVD